MVKRVTGYHLPSSLISCFRDMISFIYMKQRDVNCKWAVLTNGVTLRLVPN